MMFRDQGELKRFLRELNPLYAAYAGPLWEKGINSSDTLADIDVEDIQEAGVADKVHAKNIQTRALLLAGANRSRDHAAAECATCGARTGQ